MHVQSKKCPKCGHESADAACPTCGQAAVNGTANPKWIKPPPPPELANMVIEPVPPEMAEEFRRTFNEAEFLAALREVEAGGGVQIDDLIEECERRVNGRS
jgi:predicted amidophosphoribosyltransferase